jgi:hypothetical protein
MHFSRLVSGVGFLAGLAACGLYDLPPGQNLSTGNGGSKSTAGNGGGSSSQTTTQGSGGTSSSSSTGPSGGSGGDSTTTAGTAGSATGGGAGSAGAGGAGGSGTPDASTPDASTPDTAIAEASVDSGLTCAGHALQLEGIGYLQVTRMVQDDFTLEAWIKTVTSYSGTNFYEGNGLFYADVGGSANDFGTSVLSGKFAFGVGNPDTTIVSTTMVTTGQWVHVAATRRKSTGEIQVFVNGMLENSKIVAQTNSLSAQSLMTIGANSIDGKYFNGTIDELRIWNVVRTQPEIAGALHKALAGSEPGLVAYYRLDESDGTTARDSSAAGTNTATISGEGTWIASDAPTCP